VDRLGEMVLRRRRHATALAIFPIMEKNPERDATEFTELTEWPSPVSNSV
jgi:hypothetical protein